MIHEPSLGESTHLSSTLSNNLSSTLAANPCGLRPSFWGWQPEQILRYFQTRGYVQYFVLRDEEQASQRQIEQLIDNVVEYNDERHKLSQNFDWTQNPSPDIEWLILLHKFYFAPGLGEAFAQSGDLPYLHKWLELTERWIDTVDLAFMPTDVMGRRVQNWIFAHYHFVENQVVENQVVENQVVENQVVENQVVENRASKNWVDKNGREAAISPNFYLKFLQSLSDQVNYLCEHLTPKRNHRTIELYAIFMAAVVFPEFADATRWLDFSRAELVKNIQSDLRPDGVHCEQSTDYHHLVVKNYLGVKRLATLNRVDLPAIFDERLQSALDFAMFAHKPDGNIPSLSDGDSRSFLELLEQGSQLYANPEWLYVASQGQEGVVPAERCRLFPDGGYAILRSGWGEAAMPFTDEQFLIFDCGPLGEGNHGHFDLLSFELAAYGRSLIVDPGRYTYHEPEADSGEVNWRVRFRGTSYHNTVQVNGKEQTRYVFHKRKFKIRGPEPEWTLQDFYSGPTCDFVHGIAQSHEVDANHERMIFFVDGSYWIIADLLRADSPHQYDLRFHLSDEAQDQTILIEESGMWVMDAPGLRIAQPASRHLNEMQILEEGYVSRTYGVKHAAPVLRTTRHAADTIFHSVLYPYPKSPPAMRVEEVAVRRAGRLCPATEATGIRIMIAHQGVTWTDTFLYANPMTTVDDDVAPYSASYSAPYSAPYIANGISFLPGEPVVVRRQVRRAPRYFGRPDCTIFVDGVRL